MKRLALITVSMLLAALSWAQTVLSPEDCREMALRNSSGIRNAGLDVLASNALKQEAVTEYFPKVFVISYGFMALDPLLEIGVKDILWDSDLSADVQSAVDVLGERFGLPTSFSALKSGYSASVTAVQPIYAGGRIIAGNRLAALGRKASEAQEGLTVREILETVGRDYWKVVALEGKMNTLESSEEFLDNLARDVSAAVDAGLALDTDLMQVELKRNGLRSLRISLTGGLRLAKMSLFDAIGQPYSLIAAVSDSLKPYIDDIVLSGSLDDFPSPDECYVPEEEMLEGLPETRLLAMSVEEKRLEKRMALGEALPQVGVGAAYGYSQAIDSRFNGIVFAMLKIPLSDWRKVSRRVQRIGYDLQKASNDQEHLSAQLLLQIRELWLDLNVAWENMAVARASEVLARKTADRMLDQYEAGLVTMSDLLFSRTQLRSRIDESLDARTAYASALSAYILRQKSATKNGTP